MLKARQKLGLRKIGEVNKVFLWTHSLSLLSSILASNSGASHVCPFFSGLSYRWIHRKLPCVQSTFTCVFSTRMHIPRSYVYSTLIPHSHVYSTRADTFACYVHCCVQALRLVAGVEMTFSYYLFNSFVLIPRGRTWPSVLTSYRPERAPSIPRPCL